MKTFKVIPATRTSEGTKKPLISGWQDAATDDPNVINNWKVLFGDQYMFSGIPCGPVNDIIALDVDYDTVKGINGWQTIIDMKLFLPDTLRQMTPRGGGHLLFKFDPSRPLKNKVAFLPGLDLRTTGGWIAYYGFVDPNKDILSAPDWIYEHCQDKHVDTVPGETFKLSPPIAVDTLEIILDEIREAPPGESNQTLFVQACRAAQLVASGSYQRTYVETELLRAARERGKSDGEAKATIRSGLDTGNNNLPTCPFTAPQPVFELPAPPPPPARWTPRQMTLADLTNRSKLRKPQLFKDWSTEDIHLTVADGGTGKTTLKTQEAIHLALGIRFLGFPCMQTGKTLFITGEDSAEKIWAIIGEQLKQMGFMDGSPENNERVHTIMNSIFVKKDSDLCLVTKDRASGFLVANTYAMNLILQAVEDIQPKMIVFDPISSFWGAESGLNDMAKVITKFAADLVERSNACIDIINHIGKLSASGKDVSQFAGRGGTALPSHSRVVRTMLYLSDADYLAQTNKTYADNQSGMICNVSKFSDGSPLLNKPFVIVRTGHLFDRAETVQQVEEEDDKITDAERIFKFIKSERDKNKWPTELIIQGYFKNQSTGLSAARVKQGIAMLKYNGHQGYKVIEIDNPCLTTKEKTLTITDMDGNEI